MNATELEKSLLLGPSKEKWNRIGLARRSGVLVPLFSVFSRESLGVGDFSDLKLLVDWCKATGNSILQLLPMNELGGVFCPYDSLSSFALEPLYISAKPALVLDNASIREKLDTLRKDFPAGGPYLNYALKQAKLELFRQVFNETPSCLFREDLQQFRQENDYWLGDYSLFIALKQYHQGRAWDEWSPEYKNRDPLALGTFAREHQREIDFQAWLQLVAYREMQAAREYARANGVYLKGDLPILVSRDSADVWAHPEFFKLDFASGAPVDMYCAKGQRWGMPTYRWDKIEEDGYLYLKEKLRFAQNFYDILRIDHVVGLFRIWSIPYNDPLDNQGLNGVFDPQDEMLWQEHGQKILSVIIENTDMLLCAEDLGVIPACCPKTLKELGIIGNDVARWIKDWDERHDFLSPREYRLLAVTMLSTHDTTNFPAWWENEAGTIDQPVFVRILSRCQIDYAAVKEQLFDPEYSRNGRLRWRDAVSSVEVLLGVLGAHREEVKDIVDLYENSYREKEKLWKHLGLAGPMRERSDELIVRAALTLNLKSAAIFSIQTMVDWLYCADIFKGDPYRQRTNTPGTIRDTNWSLVMPLSLEQMLAHQVCPTIKAMVQEAQRGQG